MPARSFASTTAGTLLQPVIAEGQVHGGLGVSAWPRALCEEMVYGDDGARRRHRSAEYALISTAELPSFETHEMETPSPLNPLGVKGIGESGTVGSRRPHCTSEVSRCPEAVGIEPSTCPTRPNGSGAR